MSQNRESKVATPESSADRGLDVISILPALWTEAHAMTLVTMMEGEKYTAGELRDELMHAQGFAGPYTTLRADEYENETGWVVNPISIKQYLEGVFTKTGWVQATPHPWKKNVTVFSKTTFGEQATPLAASLLTLSQKYYATLSTFIGFPGSSETRQNVEIRLGIMRLLKEEYKQQHLPLPFHILEDTLKADWRTISRTLISMHNAGILTFLLPEGVQRGEVPYQLVDLESTQLPDANYDETRVANRLLVQILEIMRRQPKVHWSATLMRSALKKHYPDFYGEEKLKYHTVFNGLSYLRHEGYVTSAPFGSEARALVSISGKREYPSGPTQASVIDEFLSIIDGFSEGNREVMQRGVRLATEIRNNPNMVSSLMDKARRRSQAV